MASATYTLSLTPKPRLVHKSLSVYTESDPHWDWFWVCDQDYLFSICHGPGDTVLVCVYHSFTLSHSVWVQLLDRRQRHLQLAVIPVTAFTAHPSPPPHPSPYLLWEDTSEHWTNVSNYCHVTLP